MHTACIILFSLLFVCSFASDDNKVYTSRVVGNPEGKSPTMEFQLGTGRYSFQLKGNEGEVEMDVEHNKCTVNGKSVGSPCTKDKKHAKITLDDVRAQEALILNRQMGNKPYPYATVFFYDSCKLPEPEPGKVSVKDSYPLTKFAGDKHKIQLRFAVGNAEEETDYVQLRLNGRVICGWSGTTLIKEVGHYCTKLERDYANKVRVFAPEFGRQGRNVDLYEWSTFTSSLVVAVDWTRSGKSEEQIECEKFNKVPEVTLSPSEPAVDMSTLLGSRVIGNVKGNTPTMYYKYHPYHYHFKLDDETLTIEDGVCKIGQKEVGKPCDTNKTIAQVTLYNVEKLKTLDLFSYHGIFASTYFVKKCKFPKVEKDKVYEAYSFPFTKFAGGMHAVELKFAVGGAESEGRVQLLHNGKLRCSWVGHLMYIPNRKYCHALKVDQKNDLRIFEVNYTQNIYGERFDTYEWKTPTSHLTVTVDWQQNGISPEVAECKKFESGGEGGSVIPTVPPKPPGTEEPLLWGSRIVGTPRGPTPIMSFRHERNDMFMLLRTYDNQQIKIEGDQCLSNGRRVGGPCSDDGNTAKIVLDEIEDGQVLEILREDELDIDYIKVGAAYFYNKCKFPDVREGEIDINATFPLSKFVGGQEAFRLKFAVMYHRLKNEVSLSVNGNYICVWREAKLTIGHKELCGDLTHMRNGMMIFDRDMKKQSDTGYDNYEIKVGDHASLLVSVDWHQKGESPEVKECQRYWNKRK